MLCRIVTRFDFIQRNSFPAVSRASSSENHVSYPCLSHDATCSIKGRTGVELVGGSPKHARVLEPLIRLALPHSGEENQGQPTVALGVKTWKMIRRVALHNKRLT